MKLHFLLAGMMMLAKFSIGQKVGIGTSNPQAQLHVSEGSFLVSSASLGTDNLAAAPVSGSGKRLMWFAEKGAFRAGGAVGQGWDGYNIGLFSFGGGYDTKAQGLYSTTFGYSSIAAGSSSVAIGNSASSPGANSASIGYATFSSGESSVAMGRETVASGFNSLAMGSGSLASGEYTTAIGYNTKATGNYSTAMGLSTIAKSLLSTVVGSFNDSMINSSAIAWVETDPIFIIGKGNSENNRSNAITVLKNGKVGIGTTAPLTLLDVNGATSTNSLQVGNGNTISNMRSGTHTAGASASGQLTTTITFPANAFTNTPRLIATIRHDPAWNVPDVFTVLVKSISKTQAVLIIRRIDTNAAWSQNLLVDYIAMD